MGRKLNLLTPSDLDANEPAPNIVYDLEAFASMGRGLCIALLDLTGHNPR
jgi:hypothetical protein